MAENLKTSTVLSITQAEVDRGNAGLAKVDTLIQENLTLQSQVATKDKRIKELEALLTPKPPVPPPPVTPPTTVAGLYVKGGKLFTKKGVEFVVRGIESMCGSDAFSAGPDTWIATNKALGANTISPLWQSSQSSVERLTVWLDAARKAGVVVGFNADHIPDGRAWLCTKPIVDLCNKYDNLFLQCEVETGWDQTDAQWVADVKGMVKALRDAGHKHPIKVGSPAGGRIPLLPIRNGKQVLEADPLKNILFTWQSYWHKTAPAGQWHYQQASEIPVSATDPGGAIEQCKRIKDSGLCFIIGVDKEDDIGVTIYREVIAECDKHGLNVQHWVLQNDFRKGNELISHWNQSLSSITATGIEIRDLFKVKSVLPVL